MPIPDRFRSKFTENSAGCWVWIGALDKAGYGCFWSGRMVKAHRYSYLLIKGEIPANKVLDHLCRIRKCVNPDHLEPVTIAENLRRGARAARTACPWGHPYDEQNTYYSGRGNSRQCRTCRRNRMRISRVALISK